MKSKKNIAIIILYFGELPWYFDYFIHTCRYNPSVDFFLITDDSAYDDKVPKNINIIHKSFIETKKIIGKKLKLKVDFESAYKLCDFKPAYGYIFSDIVQGYDFWGHADIDIIFGDIRSFITTKLLNKFDTISLRNDFITGYFQLFKNTKKVNTLFMQSKDYKKVFTSSKHYCFDETNFTFKEFNQEIHYSVIKSEIESMTHVIMRLHEQKYIHAHFDFFVIEGAPGKLKWDKGKLIYKNEIEAVLYHLILLKNVYKPKKKIMKIPDTFYISPTRIYT